MNSYKNDQLIKFEIGTVCNFTGLFFLTFLPVILTSFGFIVDPISFKFFGLLFLFITAVLYFLSPDFLERQLMIIGTNFLIFALVQFFLPTSLYIATGKVKYVCILIGFILISYAIYAAKNKLKE